MEVELSLVEVEKSLVKHQEKEKSLPATKTTQLEMIFKFVIVCVLLASPALASAIKGHAQRYEETKGAGRLLAPIEQHRLSEQKREETKGGLAKLEQVSEQKLEEPQQQQQLPEQKLEDLQQQREEVQKVEQVQQQREEIKAPAAARYEAKPQLSRDDLAKGQKIQQREERREEQQREELSKISQVKAEPQKELIQQEQHEEKFEQQQRTSEYDSQIELKEEQRRYEETPFVQPILPLTVVEETREHVSQQQVSATKGGSSFAQAPLAEAEPYAFSYQVEGSSRSESGDTKGVVRGQYTLQGSDGASRVVDYVADQNGFRASVNTNEFGTESKSPASIALRTSQPNAEDITLRLEGKTKEDLAPPAAVKGAPALPARAENWSAKGQTSWQQIPQAAPLPTKGQKLVQQEELLTPQEPIKSAEQRASKSLPAEHRLTVQPRATFESATAHRAYKAQPAAAPKAPTRALPIAQRPQAPAASRAYLQRERYPPSPVNSGLRVAAPANPRVSFYGRESANPAPPSSANFDEEAPASGFESVERS